MTDSRDAFASYPEFGINCNLAVDNEHRFQPLKVWGMFLLTKISIRTWLRHRHFRSWWRGGGTAASSHSDVLVVKPSPHPGRVKCLKCACRFREDVQTGDINLELISIQSVFKAKWLDEITQGVSLDKKECVGMSPSLPLNYRSDFIIIEEEKKKISNECKNSLPAHSRSGLAS